MPRGSSHGRGRTATRGRLGDTSPSSTSACPFLVWDGGGRKRGEGRIGGCRDTTPTLPIHFAPSPSSPPPPLGAPADTPTRRWRTTIAPRHLPLHWPPLASATAVESWPTAPPRAGDAPATRGARAPPAGTPPSLPTRKRFPSPPPAAPPSRLFVLLWTGRVGVQQPLCRDPPPPHQLPPHPSSATNYSGSPATTPSHRLRGHATRQRQRRRRGGATTTTAAAEAAAAAAAKAAG